MLAFVLFIGGWELVAERDGLTIERRPVSDSIYHEVRVSMHVPMDPKKLSASVWRLRTEGVEGRMVKHRQMLFEKPNDRLYYQQVKTPIISDRDFTVRMRRLLDEQTGVHQILFQAENQAGPPEDDVHVRIKVLRGSWTFEPAEQGGTIVTYACVSDPAGSVPAWLVRGQQIETAALLVQEAVKFAKAER